MGVVKEKEEARREYREAIARGDGAYLMEEEKPDVFTVSVGNLPPQASVLIKITYVTELNMSGEDIVFTIPAKVAPSAGASAALSRVLQSATASVATDKPPPFGLQVALDMPYEIVEMATLNHDVRVRRTATRATVEISGECGVYLFVDCLFGWLGVLLVGCLID